MNEKILAISALIWLSAVDNAHAQSGTAADAAEQVPAAVAEAEKAMDAAKFTKEGLSPTDKADGCELHIRPTTQLSSFSSGGLAYAGGILPALIDSAIHSTQNSQFESALNKSFDPNAQIDLLNIASIRNMLHTSPGTTIIPHVNKENFVDVNYNNSGRNYNSKSICYSELIVHKIAWVSTTAAHNLESTFEFRVFGPSQSPMWTFKKLYRNSSLCFFRKVPKDATLQFLSVCFSDMFSGSFGEFEEDIRSNEPKQVLRFM